VAYILRTGFTPSAPLFQPIQPIAIGEFDGDGTLDIADLCGIHLRLGAEFARWAAPFARSAQ
jgi:hypothetical protein